MPHANINVLRGTLARYAAILEVVATSSEGLSLTEITRATGLAGGTIHRLLKALMEIGYVAQAEGQKLYRLGPRLIRLFHLAHSRSTLSSLMQPVLEGLVRRFGETAFVAKLNGESVETVASAIPENEAQSYVQPGRVMPVNAAASAKAILAFQPEATIERILEAPLHKYTDNTIVDPAELRRDFERVREQAFAVCADELDPGVLSYACPVHIPDAGVLYSVGIVALKSRLVQFEREEVLAALGAAARVIAERLRQELRSSARLAA